jgi:hypothetical protein
MLTVRSPIVFTPFFGIRGHRHHVVQAVLNQDMDD